MSRIEFIVSLSLVLCMDCESFGLLGSGDDYPKLGPEGLNCLGKTYEEYYNCTEKAVKDWHFDPEKSDPKSKEYCCGTWSAIDCYWKVIYVGFNPNTKCNGTEQLDVQRYLQEYDAVEEKTNCSQYPYESPQCTQ